MELLNSLFTRQGLKGCETSEEESETAHYDRYRRFADVTLYVALESRSGLIDSLGERIRK